MKIDQLLEVLKEKNIYLSVNSGKIKVDTPEKMMDKSLLQEIKRNKDELIQILQKSIKSVSIPLAEKKDVYSLSNAQRRLWVLDQLEDNSITYNMPGAYILEGEFSEEAFRKAYSFIIERHESLRTVFVTEKGEPKQKIIDNPNSSLVIIDLRNSPDNNKKARDFANKDFLSPFNLQKGPLVRLTIIRLEEEKYLMLSNIHHIISDGWSMNILIKDFLISYNSYREGRIPNLEPLRIHYKDFSVWQNDLLNSKEMENQRAYWLDKLSKEIPVLNLPTDKVRPVIQTFNGDNICFVLTKEIQFDLNNICRKNQVSLFMLLQALVKVLIFKYTGQKDIIVGSPIAGRIHRDLENQIGIFLNNLILRDVIESENSFIDFLKTVALTCTEAFNNQDYPYDRIIEDLDIKRDLSRSPLFDILVILQNNESAEYKFEGLNVLPYETENGKEPSKFDITIEFTEIAIGIKCIIKYNTDIYSQDRIRRMGKHLETLILSIIENPESNIKDLNIIPKDEKSLLLNKFNNTKAYYPVDKTIVDLFEEQVEKTPDNIAVVFDNNKLTYRELNEKANIVANYLLVNHNIEQNDLVGIFLYRSERMIIALLGILKSGAAYVPIEVDYPEERQKYIIQDSNPQLIISEDNNSFIDINEILKKENDIDNPAIDIRPESSLYVLYTSGTTGKPKGIITKHENVVNFVFWGRDYFFDKKIKGNFGLFSSISFDFTSTSLYLSLLRGKMLTIFDQRDDIGKIIYNVFNDSNVDSVKLTPSHISLLQDLEIRNSNIKLVISGGEELQKNHINILRETSAANFKIVNAYGPTESTMTCIVKTITEEDDRIYIGKPMCNIKIYIMTNNELTGIGIPGEICVSGAGISKGYLNRKELTRVKFVENPFSPGEKMYRTGDLGVWLPNGNIEFHGRIDNQVKIRGFRIEPGEIEMILLEYSCINSAVVAIDKNVNGENEILAYYVSDEELDIEEIRSFLKSFLPDYMIPSHFIHLDSIPLTPNGKVDRKLLPQFVGANCSSEEYVAPCNKTEEKVIEIWQEILMRERIGINDNFFELGGHSLKATRVMSRISKELEVHITLKEIFENPTIATISGIIDSANKIKYKQIDVVNKQDSYELSNAQRRLWIVNQFEENGLAYSMPEAYLLEGELKIDSFKKTYSFMLERHESLRTVFVIENGEPRQKILGNPECYIEIIDLKDKVNAEKEAQRLAEEDSLTPFNLETGPLVRFTIAEIEEDKNLLIFNTHHIISDGWSMNIFITEFLSCYNCFRDNRIPDLNPLRIQYKDYSVWQKKMLESSEVLNQKKYWLDKLSGELSVLNLPSDKVRPTSKTYNGNSLVFSINKEVNRSLKDLCRKNKVSQFMMFHAIFKVLFYHYTKQNDIIIGSPFAGRIHKDLEDQIGFYANTLVFRDSINGDQSFNEFLDSVRRTCTEAFDNQIYPFDNLVEDLEIIKDPSRSPIFDVILVLQNNESSSSVFNGLEISSYDIVNLNSKFDMTINISENEDILYCGIGYNTDIYSEDRIMRMGEHLKILASSVIEKPESKIDDLDIIPDDERKLLLNYFNDTKKDYPKGRTIIDLFEEQAGKNPDSIAVVFEDIELTYRELDRKANIVGYYLIDNYKIKPDDLIGLFLDPSEKMIIALLGILKSGAAYIPIDREYPQNRIEYILDDSALKTVIAETTDGIYINIDDILSGNSDNGNPVRTTDSNSPLYVIYTSGTTGSPKGTIINNGNYLNYISWAIEYYLKNPKIGNFGLFSSISFDLTTTSIYLSLLRGKCLKVYGPQQGISDILNDVFTGGLIDCVKLTPTHISILSSMDIDTSPVQLAIVGGEELLNDQVRILRSMNREMRIVNEYGPTETTVGSIAREIEKVDEKILIGKPVANTKIYIINNKLCPIGVPGELWIGGDGVTGGYLNHPELTSQKFIDNPVNSGERIYRTGDLARWLPCGNIEFLGRIDNQVKLRGFRIEPGEIENVLHNHDSISSALVIVKEVTTKEKQLIAYYSSDEELELSELISFMKNSLPDYMIPSKFIYLDVFPVTPNGKTDRKALLEQYGTVSRGVEYIAPRNDIERKLAEIWQEVLRIDRIGIKDNFFKLGAHSLNVIKIISRIRRDFEIDIQYKEIFQTPNILILSELIDSYIWASNKSNRIENTINNIEGREVGSI